MVQVLAALEVPEFGQREPRSLDRLGGGPGNGEQEALVGLGNGAALVPLHHDSPDCMLGHHQGHHGERAEAVAAQGLGQRGPVASLVVHRFGEEGHPALEDLSQLAVGIHRFEQRTLGLVRRVAEPPVHAEHTSIVGGGEDGCVHLELIAQRAEDRVRHLGRVGGRGQCARQRLHTLGRLGRHPPPALVTGLRPGRPQLLAALGPQVGDPDGHAGADHQCQHPEQMVELVVLARWAAQDQGEERGVEPDKCRAPDAGKGGGDERADGQESDQAELAPEHRVDERHDRDPQKGHGRRHQLGPVPLGRSGPGSWVFAFWFRHGSSPPRQRVVGITLSCHAIAPGPPPPMQWGL
jgi:hypothetical protein